MGEHPDFGEKKMCKLCWILLFSMAAAVLVAMIMLASGDKTTISPDGREAIQLEPRQRMLILAEMRTFVESIRDINQALGNGDSAMLQDATLRVGLNAQEGVPLDLMKALPFSFKKLGMDTHSKFDDLAAHAREGASTEQLLIELSQLMNNCVACHTTYQLQEKSAGPDN